MSELRDSVLAFLLPIVDEDLYGQRYDQYTGPSKIVFEPGCELGKHKHFQFYGRYVSATPIEEKNYNYFGYFKVRVHPKTGVMTLAISNPSVMTWAQGLPEHVLGTMDSFASIEDFCAAVLEGYRAQYKLFVNEMIRDVRGYLQGFILQVADAVASFGEFEGLIEDDIEITATFKMEKST